MRAEAAGGIDRQMVKRLPVNLAELTAILDEPRNGPVRAFFDRESGDVEHVPRDAEVEGVFDDIYAAPERWLEIQPLALRTRQDLRRRFVAQLGDAVIRLRLDEALAGERPLIHFAAIVRDTPGLQDEWLTFRTRELETLALTWLSAIGVEPAVPGTHPVV